MPQICHGYLPKKFFRIYIYNFPSNRLVERMEHSIGLTQNGAFIPHCEITWELLSDTEA